MASDKKDRIYIAIDLKADMPSVIGAAEYFKEAGCFKAPQRFNTKLAVSFLDSPFLYVKGDEILMI